MRHGGQVLERDVAEVSEDDLWSTLSGSSLTGASFRKHSVFFLNRSGGFTVCVAFVGRVYLGRIQEGSAIARRTRWTGRRAPRVKSIL